jgi:hypothetical protein
MSMASWGGRKSTRKSARFFNSRQLSRLASFVLFTILKKSLSYWTSELQ